MKEDILLHCCCAPCATYPFEVLKDEYDIVPFFSNSNIEPDDEYKKRLAAFKDLCALKGVAPIIDTYEPEKWHQHIRGLEAEPERGKRCRACFEFNLRRAFEYAKNKGIGRLTTTLTTTTYKDNDTIFDVGRSLSREYGVSFLEISFKKGEGHRKSVELSRKYGLYVQNYCGCVYSLQDRQKKTGRHGGQ